MRYRLARSLSASVSRTFATVVKTLLVSIVLGACVVSVMHYLGVPVPTPHELLRVLRVP